VSTSLIYRPPADATPTDLPPDLGAPASTRVAHLFRHFPAGGVEHPLRKATLAHRNRPDQAGVVPSAPPAPAPTQSRALLAADLVRQRVSELPHMPEAAMRALKTLRREDTSLEAVANELGYDASLTAKVLRLANSPFYGVPGRVRTARDAAQVLGRRTLESVLTLAAVSDLLGKPRSKAFQTGAFWRHALSSAIAARALARGARLDEDLAFVAALLHDIGLLAMSVYFPDELDHLLLTAHAEDTDLNGVEVRYALTPHALVGSWIAEHWHFAPAVVQAIADHHEPDARSVAHPLCACIHVANAIGHALDLAGLPHEQVPPVDAKAWQVFDLPQDALCRLFDDTEAGVQALCAALAL